MLKTKARTRVARAAAPDDDDSHTNTETRVLIHRATDDRPCTSEISTRLLGVGATYRTSISDLHPAKLATTKTRRNRVREIRAAMPPPDDDQERLLDKAEVIAITGRSFVTLWDWMRRGKFPRARDANGHPVWLQSEVNEWVKALPVRKFKGDRQ
jgi:predicted DNA-binding transcriptional regulator AlpA